MSIRLRIKQALCWHGVLHSVSCMLYNDGNYTYTCSNCRKKWTRDEVEKAWKEQ